MPKKPKRLRDAESSRLAKLQKAWAKASHAEQLQLLKGLPIQRYLTDMPLDKEVIANGRYLLPTAIKRIEHVVVQRRITPSEIAAELGFPEEGVALTRALARGASLRLSIIEALTVWLGEQERRFGVCDEG